MPHDFVFCFAGHRAQLGPGTRAISAPGQGDSGTKPDKGPSHSQDQARLRTKPGSGSKRAQDMEIYGPGYKKYMAQGIKIHGPRFERYMALG